MPVEVSTPADGVVSLSIDNGPRNFSTVALQVDLERALIDAESSGARVVVVGSARPGFFVSHGHIGEVVRNLSGTRDPDVSQEDLAAFLRVQKRLDTGPLVSIAAIDGQAWGGGAELAWSCDLRVASETSTFGQPEILLGVPPAGGAARLAHIAGEHVALRLVLDGRPIDAAEAHRLGLVDLLVGDGEATEHAVQWATWLARREPQALSLIKDLIVGARDLTLGQALRRETALFVSRFQEESVVERASAVQQRYDDGGDSFEAFGIPVD